MLSHPELFDLSIAHMDCDAFYASVEKRDNPDLRDKPVIIGGGKRGVVSTACYIARIKGVRSAMPMFKALALCPEAVVVKGRMEVYAAVSRQIREMMEALTPAIEPFSLDEAFLDLTGTARLHGKPPAVLLAGLVKRMRKELGITGSIGLSHNKFLAKVASDLDKPQGFAVIGRAETEDFLAEKPVRLIWGIGAAGTAALERAGIRTFADLRRWDDTALSARFGSMGLQAGRACPWPRHPPGHPQSRGQIHLQRDDLCRRHRRSGPAGRPSLAPFRKSGRSRQGQGPRRARGDAETQTRRFHHASPAARPCPAPRKWRTASIAVPPSFWPACPPARITACSASACPKSCPNTDCDRELSLLDRQEGARLDAERAADRIRAKFGPDAILKGRTLR